VTERRRYTRKQKLSVVMAAELVGVTTAAEQAGVPHRTVGYWLERPEFAEYRRKVREDLAEEVAVVAHLAWQRVGEALRADKLEPRDALFAADKATTLLQLVTGQATGRTEHRDLTTSFDDAEWEQLKNVLREAADASV
jgi:hypothetical protein